MPSLTDVDLSYGFKTDSIVALGSPSSSSPSRLDVGAIANLVQLPLCFHTLS